MRGLVLTLGILLIVGGGSQTVPPATPPPAQHTNAPTDTIGSAPNSHIMPPAPKFHYPLGQNYVFAVEWHMFTAGIASVKMESAGAQNKVTAIANSQGFVNSLFGVHDHFEALFDPHTFCSVRITKHTEEGSHKRDTDIHFDYPRLKSVLDEKNLISGETKHTENDVPSCVTDVVTGFFYLASLPLAPGDSYTFPLNDGGKTADVLARVDGFEQIKGPTGTYQTVRVSCEAVNGPLKEKGKVWAWFTNDANRTPVQMRAKMTWGTLLFRLQSVERH